MIVPPAQGWVKRTENPPTAGVGAIYNGGGLILSMARFFAALRMTAVARDMSALLLLATTALSLLLPASSSKLVKKFES